MSFIVYPPTGGGPTPTSGWQRPSEWPDIDALVGASDDKFVALFAVPDNVSSTDGQPVAFYFQTAPGGIITVDWGDGTSDTSAGNTITIGHLYDPTNANLIPTSYGYKVAIIQVTGTQPFISFELKMSDTQMNSVLPGTWSSNACEGFTYLDLCMRLPGLTDSWVNRFFNSTRGFSSIQRIRIKDGTAMGTNLLGAFRTMETLKEIIIEADTSSVTIMERMFAGNSALEKVNLFDTSGAIDVNNMFNGCRALPEVPHFDTSSVTNAIGMFSACYALTTVPVFNFSSVTVAENLRTMFNLCRSLLEVPDFPLGTISPGTLATNYTGVTSCTRIRLKAWSDANLVLQLNHNLGGEALNEIFTNLPTVAVPKNINVQDCRGRSTCTPSIATAKGWTVTT